MWVRSNTWRDERPVATGLDRFFSVFQFFDKHCNWQPKKFRICATTTSGPVFCSWVQFNFCLFSSPANWTCEHYSQSIACTLLLALRSHQRILRSMHEWAMNIKEKWVFVQWTQASISVMLVVWLFHAKRMVSNFWECNRCIIAQGHTFTNMCITVVKLALVGIDGWLFTCL